MAEGGRRTGGERALRGGKRAPESSEPEASSSEPEESSEPEAPEKPALPDGAVPESERVMGTYFDDAAFVGDSITEGIGLYGLMSNTTVLAGTSVNLDTVYTREVVKTEEGRITIMDALGQKPYAKLYIMLGGTRPGRTPRPSSPVTASCSTTSRRSSRTR